MRLILLGAPGAGKGTMCELAQAQLGWTHLSTGDLLRAEMEARLADQLSGEDREWVVAGRLVGLPFEPSMRNGNKGLSTQRGIHWPL